MSQYKANFELLQGQFNIKPHSRKQLQKPKEEHLYAPIAECTSLPAARTSSVFCLCHHLDIHAYQRPTEITTAVFVQVVQD